MKKYITKYSSRLLTLGVLFTLIIGCEREITDLEEANFSTNPEVFIDGFSGGLNYAAFGGSVPTAFQVDNQVTLNNSAASMRFEVPDAGDPRGSFAGGVFYTDVGRDLSGYTTLTFWAKASQSATIGEIGFGNDLGENKYMVYIQGLNVSTGWKKYYIPIPDPSRLTQERGLFWYAAGNIDGKGFTFWIDEVKFENLGTIAHPSFSILEGQSQTETSFVGVNREVGGLGSTFNLPTGINQRVNISPAYFEFESSNPSIATVDERGRILVTGGPGTSEITASVGDVTANGSLTINSMGVFEHAPTPAFAPENVISVFSDHYSDVPVAYYNGFWEPWQTTTSDDFIVDGDRILHYLNFNFVGIELASLVNASAMTNFHMHMFIPHGLASNAQFSIEIVDDLAGVTGVHVVNIPASQTQQWVTIDIPFADFEGLTSAAGIYQIIFADVTENINSFYADNILFHSDGTQLPPPPPPTSGPSDPAPTPTHDPANVIAVFSDFYDIIPDTGFYEDWGQATTVSEIQIQGVNTLFYQGLNYQGIQLGSSQNVSGMEFLRVDYWTENSTELRVFLISPGPVEVSFELTVPTDGWAGVDIPLSQFAPVNLNDVIQLMFVGNGDIYIGNIYFYKN